MMEALTFETASLWAALCDNDVVQCYTHDEAAAIEAAIADAFDAHDARIVGLVDEASWRSDTALIAYTRKAFLALASK